jgi:hypothetical protein
VAFIILKAYGVPEFYDKLLVVPILNLLTPALDRLAGLGVAGKFVNWETMIGPRKMNLGFMGCWVAVFVVMLTTGFVEANCLGHRSSVEVRLMKTGDVYLARPAERQAEAS